jgi:hypothetical protein
MQVIVKKKHVLATHGKDLVGVRHMNHRKMNVIKIKEQCEPLLNFFGNRDRGKKSTAFHEFTGCAVI